MRLFIIFGNIFTIKFFSQFSFLAADCLVVGESQGNSPHSVMKNPVKPLQPGRWQSNHLIHTPAGTNGYFSLIFASVASRIRTCVTQVPSYSASQKANFLLTGLSVPPIARVIRRWFSQFQVSSEILNEESKIKPMNDPGLQAWRFLVK